MFMTSKEKGYPKDKKRVALVLGPTNSRRSKQANLGTK